MQGTYERATSCVTGSNPGRDIRRRFVFAGAGLGGCGKSGLDDKAIFFELLFGFVLLGGCF